MVFGYSRVSTTTQELNGNSLTGQAQQIEAAGATKIFSETISGATRPENRPQLSALLSEIKKGDTLICTKLDRISRSCTDGYTFIQSLLDRGVKVHILNLGMMDNSTTGKLICQIFCAFAEFERSTIRERMMEGKAIARQRDDFREGRPKKFTTKKLDHALDLLSDHSYTQVSEMTGISVSTLAREVRKRKSTAAQ